jgi:hypothetical protein
MSSFHARIAIAAALAATLVPATDALAGSARTSFLLSRSSQGGLPNGPSRNGAVSHDQRIARLMAFESDASDIVQGDANGLTDVFVVHRAAPWGSNGTEWNMGTTEIASTGPGGTPANGRSYRPSLDGGSHSVPTCIAFVSDASNLVPGDTNGRPDAFVRDLRTGRIERVSVDSRGRQANGSTYEVAVDGDCERVAFVSDASNLALGRTKKGAWSTARTSRTGLGVKQVYVRIRNGRKHDEGLKGLTFLASSSDKRRAGQPGQGRQEPHPGRLRAHLRPQVPAPRKRQGGAGARVRHQARVRAAERPLGQRGFDQPVGERRRPLRGL